MVLCDLCQRDPVLPGRMLCPVCAEAICRLAEAMSALGPPKLEPAKPYRDFTIDWKRMKLIYEDEADSVSA